MSILTFIGAGQMASGLAFPAALNGHEVRLVGSPLDAEIIASLRATRFHPNLKRTLPEGIRYYEIAEVQEALQGADVVVNGVSSFGLEWFCKEMLPILPEEAPLLSVTKGLLDLEDGTMLCYPFYMEQQLPPGKHLDIHAIGGPCTSYELADGDHSHVAFCGRNPETLTRLKEIFAGPYYHVSLSTDVPGVEGAVALKNAYALAVTLAVGLSEKACGHPQFNSQAALFGQSLREMRGLLELMGGREENMIFGAGDLYVTIFGGRTRKIGTLLGMGLSFEEAMRELEGITLESIVITTRMANAVRKLEARGILSGADYPLLMHVDEIIQQGKPVDIPWDRFTLTSLQG